MNDPFSEDWAVVTAGDPLRRAESNRALDAEAGETAKALLWIVVGASVLFELGVTSIVAVVSGDEWLGFLTGLGFFGGQVMLFAIWLCSGAAPMAMRWAAGVFIFLCALAALFGGADFVLLHLIPFAMAAMGSMYAWRLTGMRVTRRRRDGSLAPRGDRKPPQYSLWQMFAVTTLAAFVAAALKGVNLGVLMVIDVATIAEMLLVWTGIAVLFEVAAWTALSKYRAPWIIVLAASLVIGWLLAQEVAGASTPSEEVLASTAIAIGMAAVVLTLLPFRLLGYRLTFRRQELPVPAA